MSGRDFELKLGREVEYEEDMDKIERGMKWHRSPVVWAVVFSLLWVVGVWTAFEYVIKTQRPGQQWVFGGPENMLRMNVKTGETWAFSGKGWVRVPEVEGREFDPDRYLAKGGK